jgi:hypothetical protein
MGAHRILAFVYRPFALDPDVLVRRAISATGLGEFSPLLPGEGLRRLAAALQQEARLSLAGRFIAGIELQRTLNNRLRLEAAWHADPSLLQRPVEAPLYITGLPRSGATLLHRLLAVDPAHRAPLAWETMWPVTPPATGWRGGGPGSWRRPAHLCRQALPRLVPLARPGPAGNS